MRSIPLPSPHLLHSLVPVHQLLPTLTHDLQPGTNTYLIGTSPSRLLIDTGEGFPAWRASLSQVLRDENCAISAALLTHWHHDHVGGVRDLRALCPGVKIYENKSPSNEEFLDIHDGDAWEVDGGGGEGKRLRAVFCPGHTDNHMAFVLETEGAVFTGDNVLGHGTAVFEDLAEYVRSLERMKGEFGEGGGRAYPGHGEVVQDGRAKCEGYIQHRAEREREVLKVVEGAGGDGVSVRGIVEVVYKDVRKDLWDAAARGVLLILRKLQGEGKVEEIGEKWRIISSGSEMKL